jgi:hypothetical protein
VSEHLDGGSALSGLRMHFLPVADPSVIEIPST